MTTLLNSFHEIYKNSDFLLEYDGLQLAIDMEAVVLKHFHKSYVTPKELQALSYGRYTHSEATVILLELSDEALGDKAWFQEKLKAKCDYCSNDTFFKLSDRPVYCSKCLSRLFKNPNLMSNNFFKNVESVFFLTDFLREIKNK